jgi:hypothetical protein
VRQSLNRDLNITRGIRRNMLDNGKPQTISLPPVPPTSAHDCASSSLCILWARKANDRANSSERTNRRSIFHAKVSAAKQNNCFPGRVREYIFDASSAMRL